jgi:uncharacterized protein (TIGR03067 family)
MITDGYQLVRLLISRFMKSTLMMVVCSVGILAFGCSKSTQSDSASMQGNWSGQELKGNAPGSPTLVIAGNTFDFHGANPNEWYKATFTLMGDTTPKRMDVLITECVLPKYVGKTAHGIYKIEDGKLTLAANEPGNPAGPVGFDDPKARVFVFTHK